MNGGGQMMQGFPRPGPALKAILIVIGALGILLALVFNYVPGGDEIFKALTCSTTQVLHGQVWRLVTAGLLTDPKQISHLFFTLIGLYFLSTDLETRWGSWRFARFMLIAVVAGFALGIVMDLVAPKELAIFHPSLMFGASAAITATAIAWASANASMQVRLFFVLPVSGRALFWVTIGYCVLGLVYAGSFSEGAAAPFGGLITGLVLGGTPSPLRTMYLKAKLAVFRRRAGRGVPTALEIATRESSEARRKRGGPPLRVVYGGLEDDLKKRKPPKDKRYLN
jgi:membrane associated rhomboid family serine protease